MLLCLCKQNLHVDSQRGQMRVTRRSCHRPFTCSRVSEAEEDEECPICCIVFPAFNYYACCGKPICTECYVHLISSTPSMDVPCPYCKSEKNSIKARILAPSAALASQPCCSVWKSLARHPVKAGPNRGCSARHMLTQSGACSSRSKMRRRSCEHGARRPPRRRQSLLPSKCAALDATTVPLRCSCSLMPHAHAAPVSRERESPTLEGAPANLL